MAECACNEAIEGALTCSDHGEAGKCFLFIVMPVSSDDAVQIAANNCIALKQSPPCPCDMMTPTDN